MSKKQETASEKPLSFSEYARRKGVSHTAVFRAVNNGRIVKGLVVLANGKKGILESVADKEWKDNTNPDHHFSRYREGGGSNNNEIDPEESKAQSQSTLNAAKRAKAVFDAKLAELEYKKKASILVEKDKVYKKLYDFGQELRNNFLALPDKVIDEILASDSRNEALTVLYDAIAQQLELLTKADKLDFSENR